MQRTRFNGRKIIGIILPPLVLLVLILADQFSKTYFEINKTEYSFGVTVVPDFFSLSYVTNSGAAWSLFADKEWGQTFFQILTAVALVVFFIFYLYAEKRYKWLKYSLVFVIGGTLGNYIDRLSYGYVVDFLSFTFGTYRFPTFNLADSFLTVGVIMLIVHYLFIDKNAVFKKKNENADV